MMTVPTIGARRRPTLDATAADWADSPWKTRQQLIWESMGGESWAQSIYGKYPLLWFIYYHLASVWVVGAIWAFAYIAYLLGA
jgi:hypothetical protein